MQQTTEQLIERISALTPFDRDSAYGLAKEPDANWRSPYRKQLHEDYWSQTIENYIQSRLADRPSDFRGLWTQINNYEDLYGSSYGQQTATKARGRGRRLAAIHSALRFFGYKRTWDEFVARRITVPVVDDGTLRKAKLNEMPDRRREAILFCLRQHLLPGTLFIDMGSGWGRYSSLVASEFPSVQVVSAELSDAGRRCTELLSDAYSLGIKTLPFDYYQWQGLADFLRAAPQTRAVVFSNHSIEQITYMDERLFRDLIASGKQIQFVHVEPIGWQILGPDNDPVLSLPPSQSDGPMGGYNKNLMPIVTKLSDEGLVEIDHLQPNWFAALGPHVTGTLLSYHSTTQA